METFTFNLNHCLVITLAMTLISCVVTENRLIRYQPRSSPDYEPRELAHESSDKATHHVINQQPGNAMQCSHFFLQILRADGGILRANMKTNH